MSLTYGFYNSQNHDRMYDAIQLSQLFDGLIADGVYQNIGNNFMVSTLGEDYQVTVDTGRGWFHHTWNYNDAKLVITMPTPPTYGTRWDMIVLDINSAINVRENTFTVVSGKATTGVPTRPTLIDDDNNLHWQIPIAEVLRQKLEDENGNIKQQYITQLVGTTTPFVNGLIRQYNISQLLSGWADAWNTWSTEFESAADLWRATQESTFESWKTGFERDANNWKNIQETSFETWKNNQESIFETWRNLQQNSFETWSRNQENIFANWSLKQKNAFTIWMTGEKREFDEWFANLQYVLDGDVAGHLQNEIDHITRDLLNPLPTKLGGTGNDEGYIHTGCVSTREEEKPNVFSTSEGYGTVATGMSSHAEGGGTITSTIERGGIEPATISDQIINSDTPYSINDNGQTITFKDSSPIVNSYFGMYLDNPTDNSYVYSAKFCIGRDKVNDADYIGVLKSGTEEYEDKGYIDPVGGHLSAYTDTNIVPSSTVGDTVTVERIRNDITPNRIHSLYFGLEIEKNDVIVFRKIYCIGPDNIDNRYYTGSLTEYPEDLTHYTDMYNVSDQIIYENEDIKILSDTLDNNRVLAIFNIPSACVYFYDTMTIHSKTSEAANYEIKLYRGVEPITLQGAKYTLFKNEDVDVYMDDSSEGYLMYVNSVKIQGRNQYTNTVHMVNPIYVKRNTNKSYRLSAMVNLWNDNSLEITFPEVIYNVSGKTIASGDYSHAEGLSNSTSGIASHVEGFNNTNLANYSHIEGRGNHITATAVNSHAEGLNNNVEKESSHAEGKETTAKGSASHAEGWLTSAEGDYSHAEGFGAAAIGHTSHAEGVAVAYGTQSHAETYGITRGDFSHAEGFGTETTEDGDYGHTEGSSTIVSGLYGHAEGQETTASKRAAHSEGYNTTASGIASHAEGSGTTASNLGSHAEGYGVIAATNYAHAEGQETTASGTASHAEGKSTTAYGEYAHAEGNNSRAIGDYSHVEGDGSKALGIDSHAGGGAIANIDHQFVHGIFGFGGETKEILPIPNGNHTGDANGVDISLPSDMLFFNGGSYGYISYSNESFNLDIQLLRKEGESWNPGHTNHVWLLILHDFLTSSSQTQNHMYAAFLMSMYNYNNSSPRLYIKIEQISNSEESAPIYALVNDTGSTLMNEGYIRIEKRRTSLADASFAAQIIRIM